MRVRLTWLFAMLMLSLLLLSTSAWERRAPIVGELLFACATLLVAIAAAGRIWCALYIAGYKRETLVTLGPYSMCRNPLYFFSLLGAIGIGLATETITIPLIVAAAFALYYPQVIRREEAYLQGRHGEEYSRYLKAVPCFFPTRRLSEPQDYSVRPILFRQNILSAAWFVLLLGAAELIEALHHAQLLPVLFTFY